MKLHYETNELDFARGFLAELANTANFQHIKIEITTDEKKVEGLIT